MANSDELLDLTARRYQNNIKNIAVLPSILAALLTVEQIMSNRKSIINHKKISVIGKSNCSSGVQYS